MRALVDENELLIYNMLHHSCIGITMGHSDSLKHTPKQVLHLFYQHQAYKDDLTDIKRISIIDRPHEQNRNIFSKILNESHRLLNCYLSR